MNHYSTLSLGEKIMHVRKAKGLSQENLAHALKRNRPFVQRIENGQAQCTAEMLAVIKKFLEIENAPLLERELALFRDQIWVLNDYSSADRTSEARAMLNEMSSILDLPFEQDLNLLYAMVEVRLLNIERNYIAAEEKLSKVEPLINDPSNDVLALYHRNKGSLYLVRGDHKNGLRHLLKTLDLVSNNVKLDARILYFIGYSYICIGKPYQAMTFLEHAKKEFKEDLTHILGSNLNAMLAMSYWFIGSYNKAETLLEASIAQAKIIGSDFTVRQFLSYMGDLKAKVGNYNEALAYSDQALAYDHGDRSITAILSNKAYCFVKMKEYAKCREVIEALKALAEGDEHTIMTYEAFEHIMTLNSSDSSAYIEDVIIPYFRAGGGGKKMFALDLCKELETHYKNKKSKIKALSMAATIREIYEEMFLLEDDLV